MKIGELAKQGGVTVQTIRFYERRHLLPEPARKESGYRDYREQDLVRLRFIRQAKALGYSLGEVREILRLRERGDCPCGEVIGMAERHLREVETRVRQLQRFRSELARALKDWKRSGVRKIRADAICILIESTIQRRPANRFPVKKV